MWNPLGGHRFYGSQPLPDRFEPPISDKCCYIAKYVACPVTLIALMIGAIVGAGLILKHTCPNSEIFLMNRKPNIEGKSGFISAKVLDSEPQGQMNICAMEEIGMYVAITLFTFSILCAIFLTAKCAAHACREYRQISQVQIPQQV